MTSSPQPEWTLFTPHRRLFVLNSINHAEANQEKGLATCERFNIIAYGSSSSFPINNNTKKRFFSLFTLSRRFELSSWCVQFFLSLIIFFSRNNNKQLLTLMCVYGKCFWCCIAYVKVRFMFILYLSKKKCRVRWREVNVLTEEKKL
jgi:hypothetical protein